MYLILWEYHVRPERCDEFERIYSAAGAWAELFRKSKGYLGTELVNDEANPQRYFTVDRWVSKTEYERFLEVWQQEYKALDEQCEGLTEREVLLGKGNIPENL